MMLPHFCLSHLQYDPPFDYYELLTCVKYVLKLLYGVIT